MPATSLDQGPIHRDLCARGDPKLVFLSNRMRDNKEAERLFKELIADDPGDFEVAYSLGLLLAEEKRLAEAVPHLKKAAAGIPGRARIRYNLGLALQAIGKKAQAEKNLKKALRLEPKNHDFLLALADHYLKRGMFSEARPLAKRMISVSPSNPAGRQILKLIEQKILR